MLSKLGFGQKSMSYMPCLHDAEIDNNVNCHAARLPRMFNFRVHLGLDEICEFNGQIRKNFD